MLYLLCHKYDILFENALSKKGLPHTEEQKEKKQGHKGKGQKNKSLLVWDILQKRTDENHAIQLKEIVEHLKMYGMGQLFDQPEFPVICKSAFQDGRTPVKYSCLDSEANSGRRVLLFPAAYP